jgi:hypothetical protein
MTNFDLKRERFAAWKRITEIRSLFSGKTCYQLRADAHAGEVYPLELGFTLDREEDYYRPLDFDGLPMRAYFSAGLQYSPTRVAAFGLAHFNRMCDTGSEESHSAFLRAAAWFCRSEDGLWRYEFPWRDLPAGWISAMAQGEGISVLVRAYRHTGDEAYLSQALRASRAFTVSLEGGGVRSRIRGQWEFLEEHPLPRPPHTLNGFLYAMVGINDLIREVPDVRERVNFDGLVETLAEQWRCWDLSYWSAYDLNLSPKGRRNFATLSYHQIHVSLVRFLAEVLQNEALSSCWRTWGAYSRSLPKRLRALYGKARYRLEVPGGH